MSLSEFELTNWKQNQFIWLNNKNGQLKLLDINFSLKKCQLSISENGNVMHSNYQNLPVFSDINVHNTVLASSMG